MEWILMIGGAENVKGGSFLLEVWIKSWKNLIKYFLLIKIDKNIEIYLKKFKIFLKKSKK